MLLQVRKKQKLRQLLRIGHSVRQVAHKDIPAAISCQIQPAGQIGQEESLLDPRGDPLLLIEVRNILLASVSVTWSQNSSDIKAHRQNQEGSGLILLFLRDL
jgi:hypothetical protein